MGVCNKVKTAQGLFSQSAILPMKKRFQQSENEGLPALQFCEIVEA
jgi:hypothetical protein